MRLLRSLAISLGLLITFVVQGNAQETIAFHEMKLGDTIRFRGKVMVR
ncbi:MAG TPA: hypothetical protein VN643_04480 [Pyrinomonadaceae bacterium]|nr:hypothetical protein [Pyrinomonadaceae bacterium]